ncbi:MAG: aminopeptidase P family protein [Candidatus Omnitrophica bacterium]|nr:aminopeptidase P family protein [Candidatus Omnitrophota bacterium]
MSILKRLERFSNVFEARNIDAFFISCEANVSYLSGYTGTESYAVLLEDKRYFLTDFRYLEQARRELKGFTIVLRDKKPYSVMVREICERHGVRRLGVEAGRISFALHRALSRACMSTSLVPIHDAIEVLRLRKDAGEIAKIRQSVEIMRLGMVSLASSLAPGMKEREIQAKLEYDTKMFGSQKPAFDIIIAADPNSSMPHAVTGETRVRENDLILVDMGCVYEGYHSDLTRCFFTGKIPPLKQKVYNTVLQAQALGIRKAGPGVKAKDVDLACREYIDKKGYGKFFGHSTGHGVGLEIHEGPSVSSRAPEVLEPGMVITVEPGIYLPGQFGVRIEDMLLITDRGAEVLTAGIPKKLQSINR